MRIARVIDQNAAFLQFVDRCGLTPGTIVTVDSRDPQAAAVAVAPRHGAQVTLGTDAATKILVTTD
jgi:histidinol phosphatase-like PHP family hydrolase